MYLVYENDDYGRPIKNILLVREASSEKEAREKASIALDNPEIVNTGFYGAKSISDKDIEEARHQLKSALEFYDRIL